VLKNIMRCFLMNSILCLIFQLSLSFGSALSCCIDDEALVYDNQRSRFTHTDQFIRVGPGLAHLSSTPFSGSHPWGAWRERRQFVGRVSYGAKVLVWYQEDRVC